MQTKVRNDCKSRTLVVMHHTGSIQHTVDCTTTLVAERAVAPQQATPRRYLQRGRRWDRMHGAVLSSENRNNCTVNGDEDTNEGS